MHLADLVLGALVMGALVLADGSGAATPPKIHEASLEAGMRVVVVSSAAAGGASTQSAAPTVAVVVVLPVGYANDAGTPGSGWAAFAAGHATFELPRWSSVVVGDSTRFFASLPADGVEAGLAELAKRLVADGVEEERFNRFLEQRKVEPGSVLDRLRETAYPTTRDGGAIATAARRTRDELKTFSPIGSAARARGGGLGRQERRPRSELARAHARHDPARARGVAPRDPREPMPRSARRVDAPTGARRGGGRSSAVARRRARRPHGARRRVARGAHRKRRDPRRRHVAGGAGRLRGRGVGGDGARRRARRGVRGGRRDRRRTGRSGGGPHRSTGRRDRRRPGAPRGRARRRRGAPRRSARDVRAGRAAARGRGRDDRALEGADPGSGEDRRDPRGRARRGRDWPSET
jgi:hypothetical protein